MSQDSEFILLKDLLSNLNQKFSNDEIGPGDDCAQLSFDDEDCSPIKLLVSSDMLVQDVHFKLEWSSLRDVGWKALAVNESDIAAMGGKTKGFTVSLAYPGGIMTTSRKEFEQGGCNKGQGDSYWSDALIELYRGFDEYLSSRNLMLYGGDIVHGPCLMIGVSVFGSSPTPILRSGASVGDLAWISGPIGLAGAGLKCLSGSIKLSSEGYNKAVNQHRRPFPQSELGVFLSRNKIASSMIDVSDGLLQDISHICTASDVSILLDESSLPLFRSGGMTLVDVYEGLVSGDDYQLFFTTSPEQNLDGMKELFPDAVCVGQVIPEKHNRIYFTQERLDKDLSETKMEESSSFLTRHGLSPDVLGYIHGR